MVSNYIIKILLRIRPFISIAIIIFSIVLFNHYAGDFQKNMPILIKELNDYIKVLLLFLYIGSVFVILYIVKLMYAYLIILLDKKNLDLIINEFTNNIQSCVDEIKKDIANDYFIESFDYFVDFKTHEFIYYVSKCLFDARYFHKSQVRLKSIFAIFSDEEFPFFIGEVNQRRTFHLIKKELSITFQHPKHIKKIWIKARNENDFLKSSATHLVHLNPMFPLGQKREIIALYFETFLKQCAELHKYGHKHGIDMHDLVMNNYQIIKLTKQN